MWIFMNNGFFSIVEDENRSDLLVVRARKKNDLQTVFNVKPNKIKKWPHRDYMYRTWLRKEVVARVIADNITNIDYGNFKDSIAKHEQDRKACYSRVWGCMYDWQNKLHPYEGGANWYQTYRYPTNGAVYSSPKTAARQNTEDFYYDVFTGDETDKYDQEDEPTEVDHQILYPRGR